MTEQPAGQKTWSNLTKYDVVDALAGGEWPEIPEEILELEEDDPKYAKAVWQQVDKILPRMAQYITEEDWQYVCHWLGNTPFYKMDQGKITTDQLHWSMWCVSGFGMPPYGDQIVFTADTRAAEILGRAYDVLCGEDS
jgi:hypothetical protein